MERTNSSVQPPENVTMKTWSPDPPNSYDAPNPGTSTLPTNTKTSISEALVPEHAVKKSSQQIQPLEKMSGKRFRKR